MSFSGTAMFRLVKKLKEIKKVLKDLNRFYYSNIELRVADTLQNLTSCQARLLASPSSQLVLEEKEAHRKWSDLAIAEERFLKQRSRVNWVRTGDTNFSFFHRIMAMQRAGNQIHYLKNSNGNKIEKLDELHTHFVSYYDNLIGESPSPLSRSVQRKIRKYTPFHCNDYFKAMLTADIKKEVIALPKNKTLGPDGFTGDFLKAPWPVLGKDITNAILEIFHNGRILKQWNSTVISLIPKTEGADKITDFRPISYCNVLYKILSNIIARRIKLILPDMIATSQSEFVKGRLLIENVLASELVQGFNKKGIS